MLTGAWALALSLSLQAAPPPTARPAASSASAVWTDDRPFTHVVQNFAHDLAHLPSLPNGGILTAGLVGVKATHPADQRLADWALRAGPSSYTKIGDVAGNGYTQAGIAVGTYVVGEIAHNAEAIHVGSDLIRGQLLNGVFTTGLKVAINRTRPTGSPHSFPSGHASASFTTAAILQAHYGWKVGGAAYALAGFVGWTRLRDRQHFISDVAFGTALGLICGHTVAAGHRERGLQITPVKTPGGGAIVFIWTP